MRRARILLHWTSLVLIVWVWLAAAPLAEALLAAALTMWVALFAAGGLGSSPGPRLPGWARRLHPWQHRALHAVLALTAVLCVACLAGRGEELLHDVVGWVVAGGSLHAALHLWRHAGLHDGALRRMTPGAMHRLL